MRIISFLRDADVVPRLGAMLPGGTELLDFTAPGAHLPLAGRHLDWFDPDGPYLPAAADLLRNLEQDPPRAAALRRVRAILPRAQVQLAAPVPRPGKVICIGLNYRDHARESGAELPKQPVVFSKFPTSVVGPEAPVVIPPGCAKADYEAELAFVIGRRAHRVPEARAYEHVLGYVPFNDVSARDFQFADGQWQRGKSCDTFAPMGEALVTADEVPDPHRLRIRLRLNGQTMQDSNTEQLVFGVPRLLAFLSESITLEPGDVVATGTPPGVGFARKPPIYLQDGDVMEVEIEGLGVLRNPVRRA